jgi:hypothetical protein
MRHPMIYRCCCVLLAGISLAACAANGVSQSVPSTNAVKRAAVATTARAEVVIHWTSPSSKSSARHKPRFISPSAQSIRVAVAPVGKSDGDVVTNVVNRSSNHSTSTLRFDAPVGQDSITFQVFDGFDGAGNQIGGASIARQAIVAGKINHVGATFEGYVSNVILSSSDPRLVPMPWAWYGVNASKQPPYALVGTGAISVTLTPVDADGNVILGSNDGPVIAAKSTNPSAIRLEPVKGTPGGYTLQAVSPFSSSASSPTIELAISATPGLDGTAISTGYTIGELSELFAASSAGISAYRMSASATIGYAVPITTSGDFGGVRLIRGLAYDGDHHRLYVADGVAMRIDAFDEDGNADPTWTPPQVVNTTGLAYSAHAHRLYVTSSENGGSVSAFDASGTAVKLTGFTGLQTLLGIAYDSWSGDVALLQGSNGATTLGEFDATGRPIASSSVVVSGPPSFSASSPIGISGAAGGLYIYGVWQEVGYEVQNWTFSTVWGRYFDGSGDYGYSDSGSNPIVAAAGDPNDAYTYLAIGNGAGINCYRQIEYPILGQLEATIPVPPNGTSFSALAVAF